MCVSSVEQDYSWFYMHQFAELWCMLHHSGGRTLSISFHIFLS